MKFCYLLLFFIILCNPAFNQVDKNVKEIEIVGIVFDETASMHINDVKCYKQDSFLAFTDSLGAFTFKAAMNDTIYFSHLSYNTTSLVIDSSFLDDSYVVGVYLAEGDYKLSEVLVLRRAKKASSSIFDARNNMNLIMSQVGNARAWDADANTTSSINDYNNSIMNKGHVKVGLSVGLGTVRYFMDKKRVKNRVGGLSWNEYNMLRQLYFMKTKK